jgi:hypothetical protein
VIVLVSKRMRLSQLPLGTNWTSYSSQVSLGYTVRLSCTCMYRDMIRSMESELYILLNTLHLSAYKAWHGKWVVYGQWPINSYCIAIFFVIKQCDLGGGQARKVLVVWTFIRGRESRELKINPFSLSLCSANSLGRSSHLLRGLTLPPSHESYE